MTSRTDAWWASSTGTGNVALTIKGLLVAIVPVAIAIARHYGIELVESELAEGIDAVTTALAAVLVAFGISRKIANHFF